jgi:hypothetical protein
MMRRVLNDMTLLTQENDMALTIDNSYYNTMFHVGINDLYDGLQTASDLFVSSSTQVYSTINIIQMVLVIVAFLLGVLYLILVLRSYLILQHHEVEQVAGLLSQVPNELDVPSHVKKVMAEVAKKKKKGKKAKGIKGQGGSDRALEDSSDHGAMAAKSVQPRGSGQDSLLPI